MSHTANAKMQSSRQTIEAGIGYISYSSDNLLLLQLMEALGERIQKDGANRTLDLLTQKQSNDETEY